MHPARWPVIGCVGIRYRESLTRPADHLADGNRQHPKQRGVRQLNRTHTTFTLSGSAAAFLAAFAREWFEVVADAAAAAGLAEG